MPDRPAKPNPPDPRRILQEIIREVTDCTTDLLAASKPLVPRDKSTLVRSGVREVHVLPGGRVEGVVTYNTPYAARQHEERSFEHPRGGQAKYLEEPLRRMAPEFERRMAAAMRRGME